MQLFSTPEETRRKNKRGLAAFGIDAEKPVASDRFRTIREGSGPTLFTIGYERRTGEQLIALLLDAGVEVLVDVRERAMSRRADFRGEALRGRCEESGIEYRPMRGLGSTDELRDGLKASRDIEAFQAAFRTHSLTNQTDGLGVLERVVRERAAALICYEREHQDCHRATLADIVGERLDATIIAL